MFKKFVIAISVIPVLMSGNAVQAQESRTPNIYGKKATEAFKDPKLYWGKMWYDVIEKPITVSGKWDAVIEQAKGMNNRDKLLLINAWVNKNIRFRTDVNGDKWDTADVALKRGNGDCEEYVVVKYQMLVASGFPAEALYVTVGKNSDGGHAILIADTGKEFVNLENKEDSLIVTHPTIYNFTPMVALNANSAWIWKK